MQLPPQPGTAGGGVCLWRPGFSWRMYRGVIATSSGVAEVCVETTCVLHNFLRAKRLQRWRRRRQEEPDVDPSPALVRDPGRAPTTPFMWPQMFEKHSYKFNPDFFCNKLFLSAFLTKALQSWLHFQFHSPENEHILQQMLWLNSNIRGGATIFLKQVFGKGMFVKYIINERGIM